MAQSSPENLLNFEPWMFKSSPFSNDSWMISEAFARETDDVLTKALQKSFYSDEIDERHHLLLDSMNSSPFLDFNPNPAVSSLSGGSDDSIRGVNVVVSSNQRNQIHQNIVPMINSGIRGGKITKRKSRASDRHKTTFINADPENFRRLVQQVTGVKFGAGGGDNNYDGVQSSSIGGVLKPEAQRLMMNRSCLPTTTLDSSSFLLDRYHQASGSSSPVGGGEGHVSYTSPPLTTVGDGGGGGGGGGMGYDSFSSFPTLESWKVM